MRSRTETMRRRPRQNWKSRPFDMIDYMVFAVLVIGLLTNQMGLWQPPQGNPNGMTNTEWDSVSDGMTKTEWIENNGVH